MHLARVSLVNYRNFERASFSFKEGVNTIIGENGSGKTNLFRAIRLILDSNMYRASYSLEESDFCRSLGRWQGHWIVISLEFENVSEDEALQALFLHNGGGVGGKEKGKSTYNLIFRPNFSIRTELSKLPKGDKKALKDFQNKITIGDYETCFTGRSTIDFATQEAYKLIVGDFENVLFPDVVPGAVGAIVQNQLSVSSEVHFTFVKALRDVVSEFSGNRQNPLFNLMKNKSAQADLSRYKHITNEVVELNSKIEQLDDVQDVRTDIGLTISETVGEAYSPPGLHIRSDLPTEADRLLQSLKLFVGETDEDYAGDISEISLGGANLIYLTLKLLEFKYQHKKEAAANFLIIEEPEAHVHTHIQKTLFENISYKNTQIIYSTHSTHISEASKLDKVNVLAKKGLRCESYQPSTGLTPEEIRHLQRYLDATRSSLLFARGVILVEGDAEELLIPVLARMVLGVSLDELGVSLINIRSTGFENVACVFNKARIKRNCSIVTDLDKAIDDYSPHPADSESVQAYKKKLKASEKSGGERKERLDAYIKGNSFLSVFYARHTFEVDFLMNGNEYEIENTVDSVYKDDSTRTLAKEQIASGDKAQAGKRVLDMARYAGKGWYALTLSDEISEVTNMPSYILKAIFHAQDGISVKSRLRMIRYRLGSFENNEEYFSKFQSATGEARELLRAYEEGTIDYESFINTIECLFEKDNVMISIVGA